MSSALRPKGGPAAGVVEGVSRLLLERGKTVGIGRRLFARAGDPRRRVAVGRHTVDVTAEAALPVTGYLSQLHVVELSSGHVGVWLERRGERVARVALNRDQAGWLAIRLRENGAPIPPP